MKFTFAELGVNVVDYDGTTYRKARSLIINQACDYIMDMIIADAAIAEMDAIPCPEDAHVDMVQQCVMIEVNPYAQLSYA